MKEAQIKEQNLENKESPLVYHQRKYELQNIL